MDTRTRYVSTLLENALRYAELGYAVFPCAPGRKTPLTRHGFQEATTDANQIERWWQQHPAANIAIATQGLVVIDIDGRDSIVMREMLDAGCRPALIVCEHMDRHYSIGTTAPSPIPEWLLGTKTEHGHTIQDTAETLHWMAAKYGYERIGLNRCNSFFVRKDLFPLLFRG